MKQAKNTTKSTLIQNLKKIGIALLKAIDVLHKSQTQMKRWYVIREALDTNVNRRDSNCGCLKDE